MKRRGGFIEGYYTPASAFILEHVRMRVMDDHETVPDDYSEIRADVIKEIREKWEGPGQSDVISLLVLRPFSGLGHMIASLDCRFRIIYDPRHDKEAKAVQAYIDGFGEVIHRHEHR